jgi:hypothetical protein
MVSVQHSDSKKWIFGFLLLTAVACGGSKEVQKTTPPVVAPTTIQESSKGGPAVTPTETKTVEEEAPKKRSLFDEKVYEEKPAPKQRDMVISYGNKSTNINVPLNLDEPFYLELKGTPASKTLRYDRELFAVEMRQIMRDFRKAQDAFFKKEYEAALEAVNRSLLTLETADALALKGSIYYVMKNIPKAKTYWAKAVKLDPEIVVPEIPNDPANNTAAPNQSQLPGGTKN